MPIVLLYFLEAAVTTYMHVDAGLNPLSVREEAKHTKCRVEFESLQKIFAALQIDRTSISSVVNNHHIPASSPNFIIRSCNSPRRNAS